ncbi:Na/Pi cotransporter family protein [Thomasclavelia sp.]|uniref:Na/Pi cotransporter family protein n=1 Tax=Thomasclavelia sp. TaxID=3025757 RepID=UPI0025EEE0A1|nr:Na/Pi cotransporter family protein [Thomasclavelia sp.]
MKITDIFTLLGGLALFLYGMTMMSNGLELVAGNKMKTILEKLTTNRFLGVIVGALITAVIQSSSATTVMTVGFVNAGLMKLKNAVWIIMGANIGTTITGQLIVIDISAIAPLIAFLGVALIAFFKNKKLDMIGTIVAGLGILFMGMEMMSGAMMPLRDSKEFVNIVSTFQNPLIGIVVGAVFTAIIQSSSASVGILIALAKSGVISLSSAIYVLFGQNIGTCITAVLASIGTSRNAKRTMIIHLSFNVIGTIIFVTLSLLLPFADFITLLTPNNVPAQIANVHTIFNIGTTLILLPFGSYLVKLSYKLLPKKDEDEQVLEVKYLDKSIFTNDYYIGTSAIANRQLFNEIQNMLEVVKNNLAASFSLMVKWNDKQFDEIMEQEKYIDYLNKEIIEFTTLAISSNLPIENSRSIGLVLKTAGDLERIGDHAINIAKRAKRLEDNQETFSSYAKVEIKTMNQLTMDLLEKLCTSNLDDFSTSANEIQTIEKTIDQKTSEFSYRQLLRLRDKKCTPENSALFTETLIDFERIGDHGVNIANAFNEIKDVVTKV